MSTLLVGGFSMRACVEDVLVCLVVVPEVCGMYRDRCSLAGFR